MNRPIIRIILLAVVELIATAAFPFGKNKIAYDRFNWSIYHSTHFDVYFYDEEKPSLQKMVNFAESDYDDLSRKLNFQITKKIPIIFYATHSEFEETNVELNFIPEGVGAFASPVRERMVLPIDMPDEELIAVLKHEMTHIFQYEIFFRGKVTSELRANPPTWLMEGMASFFGQDETSKDRMVLRDAVVNDRIPSIKKGPEGYFAYRYGHAVFDYILAKWGWDGVRDFIYEYRSNLGNSIEKPLKRAFDISIEDFDTHFRTWLRKEYLPALISKGEPTEYGEPFIVNPQLETEELSPAPDPSGDLMAGLTTYKDDVDVALFNVPERKLLKNLTPGLPEKYEYIIGQSLTVGPVMGRDVGFSPNGDQVAVFVKKEKGRNLLLVNALTGGLDRSISMKVEQQLSPAYSPDGKRIAFSGFEGNHSDIFIYDLASGSITDVTNDPYFDGAPVFSPDGNSIVYSSVANGFAKLFRIDLADPTKRYQLTSGPSNDIDAWFSPDGKRVFYVSDRDTGRNGIEASALLQKDERQAQPDSVTPAPNPANFAVYNVYSLDLASGDTLQFTDVVGGCFTPVVFTGVGNKERLVFSSYYKGRWRLYTTLTDKPLHAAVKTTIPSTPMLQAERSQFKPPVEVAIDSDKIQKYNNHRLFVDDVQVNIGVASDQTIVSQSVIFSSDMLGDRQLISSLDSVSTFSNFDFTYLDLQKRLNWGFRVFDDRSYFVTQNVSSDLFTRKQLYEVTGALGIFSYPFDRYHRLDTAVGYERRSINFPFEQEDGSLIFVPRTDSFPIISADLSGDSAQFKQFGPISGRRYDLTADYAPDVQHGGTLTTDYSLDFRQYLQVTSRALLAARIFGGYSSGNFPNFFYFGGLNTLRGYDFESLVGNRAFYTNLEIRFPFIDLVATPLFYLTDVRGSLFLDMGGAWFNGQPFQFESGGRLKDGLGSVGYGVAFNFLGLELHWDFAKRTDLRNTQPKTYTEFWIGETF